MHRINQKTGYVEENTELECEIVREHLIPQWGEKDYNSFKSYVDDALKSYKMSDDIDTPEIERIIFKPPNNPIKDIDNPVNKILVTEKERDDNFDVVKIVQDYVIEIGSEFYCSEKKANCLVEGFEPYDYREDLELNIIVRYEDDEKGKSTINDLSPISTAPSS